MHIIAGSPNTVHAEFFVHQSLIDPRSELIARTLSDLPLEPGYRKISLPNREPEVVSQYIKLLYVCIPCIQACLISDHSQTDKLPRKNSNTDVGTATDKYLTLVKLYVLAETLIDEVTKNAILDEFHARCLEQDDKGMHDQPSLLTTQTIYSGTKDESRARAWLVDLYTNGIGNETPLNLFPIAKDFPQPFLADLVTRTITFCPLPTQLHLMRNEVKDAKTQTQAHLNAKLQLGDHFAKKEEQLGKKLAKTEERYKGACRDISTMQSARDQAQRAKAALEENLKKAREDKATLVEDLNEARAEVDILKRRPVNTLTTSAWDRPAQDLYRNR